MQVSSWGRAVALVALVSAYPVVWAQKPSEAADTKVSAAVIRPGVGSFASYLPAGTSAAAPAGPAFVLRKGEPLHLQLQAWAHAAGWELLWLPDVSWKVIGDVSYPGVTDVTAAVGEVISVVREEGKPVRLSIADGNKIMEVISTDIVSNRGVNDE